jgi:hypothetical protein
MLVKMADEKVSIKMKVAIAGVSFTLPSLLGFIDSNAVFRATHEQS